MSSYIFVLVLIFVVFCMWCSIQREIDQLRAGFERIPLYHETVQQKKPQNYIRDVKVEPKPIQVSDSYLSKLVSDRL